MCVLSIKVPIQKKSGNLFNDPRIYNGEPKGLQNSLALKLEAIMLHHLKSLFSQVFDPI